MSGKPITQLEATEKYHALRLSAVVYVLKHRGYNIITHRCTKYENGEVVNYAKYELIQQEND